MAAPLGFKTFTTGEVLTAADTNGYLMQGVLVFADAAARSAAITSPQEGQTSYLKDTDEIQVYSGSAWVTKSGGLPSQTGNSGKYLTTDGTNPSWGTVAAGGMTLISTTTFNGTPTTLLSSIPQTYNDLRVVIRQALPATDATELRFRLNNDATANRYRSNDFPTSSATATFNDTYGLLSLNHDNAVSQSLAIIDIPDYTNTTTWKQYTSYCFNNNSTTTTSVDTRLQFGVYNQTAAISSLGFFFSSGNATSGTILLYGVK